MPPRFDKQITSKGRKKLYFPQLDSVRGISFLAIFFFHALQPQFSEESFIKYLFENLPLAIDVFFILSSFLLTYLALSEYQQKGNFSFKNYFIRRVLRIWPLYYTLLFIAFLLIGNLANWLHYSITLPQPVYYIFFIANFYSPDHVFFLKLLWTISVEEQFYLLWGFCLRFLNKYLQWIIFILYAVSIAFTIYRIIHQASYYFNTITYLFDFASGGLAAAMIFKSNMIIKKIKTFSKTATIIFYCYLVLHFTVFYYLSKNTSGITNNLIALISRYIFILYIALFIAEQMINENRMHHFAKNDFLIYTGKISYGLYCFHGITILLLSKLFELFKWHIPNIIQAIVILIINYLIASVSYFYLEKPFLKLKDKWKRV